MRCKNIMEQIANRAGHFDLGAGSQGNDIFNSFYWYFTRWRDQRSYFTSLYISHRVPSPVNSKGSVAFLASYLLNILPWHHLKRSPLPGQLCPVLLYNLKSPLSAYGQFYSLKVKGMREEIPVMSFSEKENLLKFLFLPQLTLMTWPQENREYVESWGLKQPLRLSLTNCLVTMGLPI